MPRVALQPFAFDLKKVTFSCNNVRYWSLFKVTS